MGNQPVKPEKEAEEILRARVDAGCAAAADAVIAADALLFCTGAGWSADSGLAVYRDIAKVEAYAARDVDYRDLCVPRWLKEEPALFWGFWGLCFNDYRETKPHAGYALVKGWRDAKFAASPEAKAVARRVTQQESFPDESDLDPADEAWVRAGVAPPGAFFHFTSNVDAHSYDHFSAGEIRECHGNTEVYQCGGRLYRDDEDGTEVVGNRPCRSAVWRAPKSLAPFAVDPDTMLAADGPRAAPTAAAKAGADGPATVGATGGATRDASDLLRHMPPATADHAAAFSGNWPKCPHCGGPARPAILMFDDGQWVDSAAQDRRYREWVLAVRWLASQRRESGQEPLRVAIVEVGAGGNVTTVRCESEHVFKGADHVETTLVRINPELPLADGSPDSLAKGNVSVIPVMERGLAAVEKIDAALREKRPDLFARDDYAGIPDGDDDDDATGSGLFAPGGACAIPRDDGDDDAATVEGE